VVRRHRQERHRVDARLADRAEVVLTESAASGIRTMLIAGSSATSLTPVSSSMTKGSEKA
jgi:uncharacterized phosphosugar-binding protein